MSRLIFSVLGLGLAACSPVVAHTPDAQKQPDAAPPDAPTHGVVTVKVLDPNGTGTPAVNVPVVFVEPDGTVAGHPNTDATGTAMLDVHNGASVTAVEAISATSTRMYTVRGVKLGDTITIGQVSPPSTSVGNFTVNFSTATGANSYVVYGPCGSTSVAASPATLSMSSDCMQSSMELQVHAYNGSTLVGYVIKQGVPFAANGSVSMPGTYQPYAAFTIGYTNLTNVTSVSTNRYAPDLRNGFSSNASGTPSNGQLSLSLPGPTTTNAWVSSSMRTASGSSQQFEHKVAGALQTDMLDGATTLLPWITGVTFDAASGAFTVTTDSTGTTSDDPDLFLTYFIYNRTVNNVGQSYLWYVFSDKPGNFTLPAIPIEVGDVMPKAGDTMRPPIAGSIESDAVSGWDQVRSDVFGKINAAEDSRGTATKIRISVAPQALQ